MPVSRPDETPSAMLQLKAREHIGIQIKDQTLQRIEHRQLILHKHDASRSLLILLSETRVFCVHRERRAMTPVIESDDTRSVRRTSFGLIGRGREVGLIAPEYSCECVLLGVGCSVF